MPTSIREIIVYRIQPDRLDQFLAIKQQMIAESVTLEGLRSSTTARVLGEGNVFADTMVWDSKQASEAAMPAFEKLPTAPTFLGLFDGPPLQHLFLEYEPEPAATAS